MLYVRYEVGGSIVGTHIGFEDTTRCFTNGTLRGCAVAVTCRAKPSDKVASRFLRNGCMSREANA